MVGASRSVYGGVVAWMKCIKEYAINWVEPKDIAIPEFDTEDDSWESPFKVLTNEEMNYIVNHGCLPGIEPIQK